MILLEKTYDDTMYEITLVKEHKNGNITIKLRRLENGTILATKRKLNPDAFDGTHRRNHPLDENGQDHKGREEGKEN